MDSYFTEAQESIIKEINQARHELIAGRHEECYRILTDLSDELTADVLISKKEELNPAGNDNV